MQSFNLKKIGKYAEYCNLIHTISKRDGKGLEEGDEIECMEKIEVDNDSKWENKVNSQNVCEV